tara:strand:- start:4294 stop:5664 length:1371 start_codon:yes stop_codon:yes gene_type:complete
MLLHTRSIIIVTILYTLLTACSSTKEVSNSSNPNDYTNTLSISSSEYPSKAVIVTNISTESNSNINLTNLSSKIILPKESEVKLPYHFISPLNISNLFEEKEENPNLKKNILKNTTTTKNFFVFNFENNTNYIVTANLKHTGTHCLIYAEENDTINTESWENIASFFDNTIYPNATNILNNTPTDVDNNNKVILLYYNMNFESENNALLGYFWSYDLFTSESLNYNFTNEAEILYLNINEGITSTKNKETIAHELTHLISLSKRIKDSNTLSQYDIWIEEGIASGASGFLINEKITDYINYYGLNNTDNELRNGLGLLISNTTNYSAWNYGLSFAFMEYCRLQYNQDGSFYGLLINNYSNNDYTDIFSVLTSLDSTKFESFEEIIPYFHAANVVNQTTGLLGYKGYYTISALEPSSTNLEIGSGGAIYYLSNIENLSNFTNYDQYDDDLLFILLNH